MVRTALRFVIIGKIFKIFLVIWDNGRKEKLWIVLTMMGTMNQEIVDGQLQLNNQLTPGNAENND